MDDEKEKNLQIAFFRGKSIRKKLFQKEWWFSILDIINILTNSPQPKTYWAKMKQRDKEMSEPFPFWEQLKMPADDARVGGQIAGTARKQIERKLGKSIVSKKNFLQNQKKLKNKFSV